MAEQLELDEIRAHALNNIGNARVTLGDAGGVADLERSVEISAAVGSVESVRGYLNLGTLLNRPRPSGAGLSRCTPREGGSPRGWATPPASAGSPSSDSFECYWTGWWDDAAADVEALLAAVEGPADYYTELRSPAGPGLDPPGPWRSRRCPRRCRAVRRARPGGRAIRRRSIRRSRSRHGQTVRCRRRVRGLGARPASCSSPGGRAPSRPRASGRPT